jgi:formiminotetrahydrofolate cyclodeaminase
MGASAPGAESIERYLEALASAAPAPGGGSAAALAGAMAAALVAMVCRVTASRGGDAALAGVVASADVLRERLLGLGGDDAAAYEAVIAARRLPPDARPGAVQAALRRATEVPLDVVEAARDVLASCARVAGAARPSTLGDLRVAAALARAALEGAAVTARLNLRDAADPAFVAASDRRLREAEAAGERLHRTASEEIARRAGGLA